MHPGAHALIERGRFAEAAALLQQELASLSHPGAHPFRDAPPTLGLDAAELLEQLGTVLWHLARLHEAGTALRRARALREAHGQAEPLLSAVIERQAAVLHHLGDDGARSLFERAIAVRHRESLEAATARRNFGAYLRDRGEVARARRELEAALRLTIQRVGRRHPESVAAHKALARHFLMHGMPEQALGVGEAALELALRVHPEDHPFIGGALLTIGVALRQTGVWRRAAESIARAEKLFAGGYGDDHPLVALAIAAMADLAVATREIDQAVELYTEAVRIYAVTYEQHPFLADLLLRAARPLQGVGRWEEALAPLLGAMHILEPLGDTSLARRRVLAFDLARTYARLGHDGEAHAWAHRAARLTAGGEDAAPP